MKKSLNNRIRGKRLVTGDENEVTKNEILLQDKDDKIIVKQRGASGEMENISGGDGFNIWYYCTGSVKTESGGLKSGTIMGYAPYKNFEDFLFSKDNPEYATNILYSSTTKRVILPQDNNIEVSSVDNYGNVSIYIQVSPGAKGIASNNPLDIPISDLVLEQDIKNDNNKAYTHKNIDVLNNVKVVYDATTNIVYYYTGSSSLSIWINPELESSLRIKAYSNYDDYAMVNGIKHYLLK